MMLKSRIRPGVSVLVIPLLLILTSCSDSGTATVPSSEPLPVSDPVTEPGSELGNDPGNNPGNDPGNDPGNNPGNDLGNGPADDEGLTSPAGNMTDVNTSEIDTPVVNTPVASGSDLSGGEDDSPTTTESLSLVGPFIKDTTRGAGPPSVPTGLTLLLSADNWLEFSWVPSTDDQSVEAYEIYRDGQLQYTIRGDSGYEFDYRSWISTSYIDCNYTRYPNCEGTQPAVGSSHEYTVVAVDNEGMRSAPSEPQVFQLNQPANSSVDLSSYSVVFNEEFTDPELNRNRWKTALPWGEDTIINGERQYFVNIFASEPLAYDPFVLDGNTLSISGIPTPPELSDAANGLPYLSGVITTSDYFKMTYGYVEMSAKVVGGDGLLSTFYLFNQDFEKNKPEIDIIEYIGSRPDKAYQTYHYYDSNRARYFSGEKHSSPTMESVSNIDLSADFHTYSVLWEPGLIVWYIDGQEVRRITGIRVSDEPMNIIAQLVIGSEWIGTPDNANLPARFEIDYIRAWQKN